MSDDYTLHTKVSSNGMFETWRGTCKRAPADLPSLIRVDPDPTKNGDTLVGDAQAINTIVNALKNKKHEAYFPIPTSWANDEGFVIYTMDPSALSLREVSKAFDHDVPLADAAWMINRLLEALHLSHQAGYIHCSVTPDNFFIIPDTHEGKLLGFEFNSNTTGPSCCHIDPNWTGFYPEESPLHGNQVTPATDVYMASMMIGFLLPALPEDTPEELTCLLTACQLVRNKRVQTIQELHDDFNKIIKAQFGPRKFRPLVLP